MSGARSGFKPSVGDRTMRILLTGATGFIGRALTLRLAGIPDNNLLAVSRRPLSSLPRTVSNVLVDGLASGTDWKQPLRDVQVVIHAAARVHVVNDRASDPLAEYREVNVQGTLNLARQAADAGVERFIFISSIKVNGESTAPAKPFTAFDAPKPIDPYGITKHEAEQGLRRLAAGTGMEVVIIRPVIVYGPGVKANFRSLMAWLDKGVPLPLGSVRNKRSLVALDNLVDLIVNCMNHPAAANRTFLVSDGEDLSTTELLHRMGKALGKRAVLLPFPVRLLRFGAALLGKEALIRRLCGSLQVDISHTCRRLDWQPPIPVDEGLRRAAEGYQGGR